MTVVQNPEAFSVPGKYFTTHRQAAVNFAVANNADVMANGELPYAYIVKATVSANYANSPSVEEYPAAGYNAPGSVVLFKDIGYLNKQVIKPPTFDSYFPGYEPGCYAYIAGDPGSCNPYPRPPFL